MTHRERTVGRQAVLVVGAQDERRAGGRLLERLEERRLGVVVHAMRALDERHAPAALDGHQRQLGHQVADPPDVLATDRDCWPAPPGASRCRSG